MTFGQAIEELKQNEKFRHLVPSKLYYDYLADDWETLNNLKDA